MFNLKNNKKAIAMVVILGTIVIVFVLAGAILVMSSSQSRLVHHQVSRIQGYYASMLGVNYAYRQLYTGAWLIPPAGGSDAYSICRNAGLGCTLVESNLPHTVSRVNISVTNCSTTSPSGISACISATAIYTYTPP
ncbi:MAG: SurA N-terminal domain-containing protein [Candidatus Omnitrophica bacterium]|nr:SurA N-terminal domain-containing protein [Candidatus Omnitrophota bacterium]